MFKVSCLDFKTKLCYFVLIMPFISEMIKKEIIINISPLQIRFIIEISESKDIFRLSYKYNKNAIIECFKFKNYLFLQYVPIDLITEEFLDSVDIYYDELINIIYNNDSFIRVNIGSDILEKIIDIKRDLLLSILESNKPIKSNFPVNKEKEFLTNKLNSLNYNDSLGCIDNKVDVVNKRVLVKKN